MRMVYAQAGTTRAVMVPQSTGLHYCINGVVRTKGLDVLPGRYTYLWFQLPGTYNFMCTVLRDRS
jgi:hypothetical protein